MDSEQSIQEINGLKVYSPIEENINIFSHAVGLILSVLATIFLFQKSLLSADILSLFSALVFGFGLMAERARMGSARIRLPGFMGKVFGSAFIGSGVFLASATQK